MKTPRLIILSAPPAQGKSTHAAKLGIKIICADTCRKILTGSESDMSRDDYVWGHIMPERLKVAYENREDCLFDTTNVTVKRRREVMKMGKRAGFTSFECHYFEPDLDKCFKQNKMRDRFVPENIIENFCKKWEVPTLDEGFSLILNLTTGEKTERM